MYASPSQAIRLSWRVSTVEFGTLVIDSGPVGCTTLLSFGALFHRRQTCLVSMSKAGFATRLQKWNACMKAWARMAAVENTVMVQAVVKIWLSPGVEKPTSIMLRKPLIYDRCSIDVQFGWMFDRRPGFGYMLNRGLIGHRGGLRWDRGPFFYLFDRVFAKWPGIIFRITLPPYRQLTFQSVVKIMSDICKSVIKMGSSTRQPLRLRLYLPQPLTSWGGLVPPPPDPQSCLFTAWVP